MSLEELEDLLRDFRRFLDQMKDEAAKIEARQWLASLSDSQALPQDAASRAKVLQDIVRLCIRGQLQPLLAAYKIPHPSYNYFEGFTQNVHGPWDRLPRTSQAPTPALWSVLGFEVGFPLGIPASVLTATERWIDYYARCGFNILTYKTVRSIEAGWEAHPSPNWIFLNNLNQPLIPGEPLPVAVGDQFAWPDDPNAFSTANSFGVPSFPPQVWQKDVVAALERLRSDQLLIVSVMGTYERYQGEELVQDFVRVARLAEETGAHVLELNLSCPNTIDPETGAVKKGLICEQPATTMRIVQEVRDALSKDTKLVIKLGAMSKELLEQVVIPVSEGIDAVSGINTIQMQVKKPDGDPAFVGTPSDPKAPRNLAGVSGVAIRKYGLQFVRDLADIRRENHLRFDIIGMGGVMNAADVDLYQRAGANAVQTATAAFFNPALPQHVHDQLLGSVPRLETSLAASSHVMELLNGSALSLRELAEQIARNMHESKELGEFFNRDRLVAEKTRALLERLEAEGRIVSTREGGRVVFRRSTTEHEVDSLELVS